MQGRGQRQQQRQNRQRKNKNTDKEKDKHHHKDNFSTSSANEGGREGKDPTAGHLSGQEDCGCDDSETALRRYLLVIIR